jgi:prepilin-type N-terminal cleavage/methylation domain-containing protein
MSIINKILSKKIHFHVSLRGLFPFCHSRESGNPSSLSLRGAKQACPFVSRGSNLKGFSLIELMVAVVILSIALIGIFLAFSSGWMGMANARDRTVATNYAREAMENVKNMDFELVTNENLGIAEPVGAKFTRVIVVNTENANLKKIDTKVSWTNRQDQEVSVETSMYINRTIFNPGEATHIILYADPYYTVLPDEGHANIIAAIKDINNTTVIDWTGGDIRFSIDEASSSGSGFLSEDGTYTLDVTPTNGIAQTTFHGTDVGDVVIMASVNLPNGGGTISDTITITVTMGVVRIALSADPKSIDDTGPNNISTVTATLVDSGGFPVATAQNEITFDIDIFDSEGTLLDSTTEDKTAEGGVATIDVQSIEDTPGVATVTASSDGLISGTVNIIIAGDAASISVSVHPPLIYINDTDGVRVTVEIQDIYENPVEYMDPINLSISGGTGFFVQDSDCDPPISDSLCFDNETSKYTTFYPTSVGMITITASGEGLADGSATIDVEEALIADTITLKADPKNILAGGLGGTEGKITATIKQGFTVISNYNRDITFEIISDTSNLHDAELYFNGVPCGTFLTVLGVDYGSDGVAVVDLKPATEVGICTVKVSTENSEGTLIENTIEIGFYSGEHHIRLTAVPSKMLVNGDTCTVTAVVEAENDIQVYGYNEDITFTILVGWPKNAKFAATGTSSLTKTLIGGETDIILISQSTAGTVTLKASSFTDTTDITGYLNIPVDINFLDLTDPLNIAYDDVLEKVSFDIEVRGTEISLEQMKVSWSDNIPLELLNKIDIGETVVVYSNDDGVASGTVVETVATLPIDTFTINLYFNEVAIMSGKTFNIIFYSSSENYPVEFEVL